MEHRADIYNKLRRSYNYHEQYNHNTTDYHDHIRIVIATKQWRHAWNYTRVDHFNNFGSHDFHYNIGRLHHDSDFVDDQHDDQRVNWIAINLD